MQISATVHGPHHFDRRPAPATQAAPSHPAPPAAGRSTPVTGQSSVSTAAIDPVAIAAAAEDTAEAGAGKGATVTHSFVETENGWTRTHSVVLPNGKTLSWEKSVDAATQSRTFTRSRIDADGTGTERTLQIVKNPDGGGATVTRSFNDILPPVPDVLPAEDETPVDPPPEVPVSEALPADPAVDQRPFEELVV